MDPTVPRSISPRAAISAVVAGTLVSIGRAQSDPLPLVHDARVSLAGWTDGKSALNRVGKSLSAPDRPNLTER